MRIWLAPSAFAPHRGGVEELTLQLGRCLQQRGIDVLIVTHRYPAALPERETVDDLDVRRIEFVSPGRRIAALRGFAAGAVTGMRRLDGLPRPDVVHIQCPSNQTALLAAWCRRRGVPLVISSQGETEMDAGRIYQRSRWMRSVLRLASRQSAALTGCSAWTVEHAALVAPAFSRAAVVPNAVVPADWAMPGTPDAPVFAAWGRHVPQKGFDLLLAAFDLVRQERPAARLLIGGDGPETPKLRQLAGDGVEFLGSLDRAGVRAMLGQARVGVVPSRIEPFGIVALEILAAGRQLVYSAGTGLFEAAGPFGIAVDVNDKERLASAMIRSLTSPLEPVTAGNWLAEHTWEAVTDSYAAIYERVTSSSR